MGDGMEAWIGLWPAALLTTYFIGGMLVYAVRYALVGSWRDENLEGREATVLLGQWLRLCFAWLMRPVFAALQASRIPADIITTLSALLATGAAVALGTGHLVLGGWLLLFGGMCDFLDGRLARAAGSSSPSGAALDSVLDRYSDSVVLIGLAVFYRESWVLVPVLALMVAGSMVSYVRARGEGLGVAVKGGVAQRAERIFVLGASLVFSPLLEVAWPTAPGEPAAKLVIGGVLLMGALAAWTAGLRLVRLHNALGGRLFQGWGGSGRGGLLRHTASAVVATAADFATVWALVSQLEVAPWVATALGCVVGAAVNFGINRVWAYQGEGSLAGQGLRYTMVSASSALLNAGGVALMLDVQGMAYPAAWGIARVLSFLFWNYPLQKLYVFSNEEAPEAPRAEEAPEEAPRGGSSQAPRVGTALLAAVVGASVLLGSAGGAEAQVFKPSVQDDGDYSESWTAVADLSDGTYVQLQLAISNIGPGDRSGICRALVVPASGSAWTESATVDAEAWAFKGGKLQVGTCSAQSTKEGMRYSVSVGGGTALLSFAEPAAAVTPPLGRIKVGDDLYTTELLTRRSALKATLRLPGKAAREVEGFGYADHTRSTVLPGELAERWVRVRALSEEGSLLMVARVAPGGGAPKGWVWLQGAEAPETLKAVTLKAAGGGWTIGFKAASGSWEVATGRLLFRHAPVEGHGLLGSLVGSVVGNPVTRTWRGESSGGAAISKNIIVEVSVSDE